MYRMKFVTVTGALSGYNSTVISPASVSMRILGFDREQEETMNKIIRKDKMFAGLLLRVGIKLLK